MGAVEDRVEPPQDDRMRQAPDDLRLAFELAPGAFVLDLVGAEKLRDDQREQPLVPGEVGTTSLLCCRRAA